MQLIINENTHTYESFDKPDITELIINCDAIAPFSFSYCFNLKNVVFNNPNTKIFWNSFEYCENLESVVLPENIREIPDDCFTNCKSLKSIVIPQFTELIGKNAFYNTDLSGGIIFKNINTINISSNAFALTNLKILNLSDKVKMDSRAFYANDLLDIIYFGKEMPIFLTSSFEQCNNIKEIYLPLFCNINNANVDFGEKIKYYLNCNKDEYLSNIVLKKFNVRNVTYLNSLENLLDQGKTLREIAKIFKKGQ